MLRLRNAESMFNCTAWDNYRYMLKKGKFYASIKRGIIKIRYKNIIAKYMLHQFTIQRAILTFCGDYPEKLDKLLKGEHNV